MNVQIPGYLKTFPFAPQGRFYVFPYSQMVTHHIEFYKDGINTKKRHFNIVAKKITLKTRKAVTHIYIL